MPEDEDPLSEPGIEHGGHWELDDPVAPEDNNDVSAEDDVVERHSKSKEFLEKEATSITHLCTHLPKNPYCASCMRAKVNQVQNRRRGNKKHYRSY